MGPLGMPEIIMILIVGIIVLGIPAVIALVVIFATRRNNGPTPPQNPPLVDRESRLLELESLKDKNLISDPEYQEQRKRILESI